MSQLYKYNTYKIKIKLINSLINVIKVIYSNNIKIYLNIIIIIQASEIFFEYIVREISNICAVIYLWGCQGYRRYFLNYK